MELLFCQSFVRSPGLNASQAAREAGYRGENLDVISNSLLKKPRVKLMIAELEKQIQGKPEDVIDEAKEVLNELRILAFQDPAHFFDENGAVLDGKGIQKLGPERRAIASIKSKTRTSPDGTKEVETEIRFRSKEDGLEMLGRHHRLYTDVIQSTVTVAPIILPDNGTHQIDESQIPRSNDQPK